MRRLLILAGIAAIGALPFATASAGTKGSAATRSICHATGKSANPYVKLKVSASQLRAHLRHPADIYPAPKACPRTRLTATSGGVALATNLVGEAESPAGDPVGTGTATIRLRRGQAQACFSIHADNITLPAAGSHIHVGGAGTSGAIVVPLTAPGADGNSSGCVATTRALVGQILDNSAGYYVNVHTTDFPGGAIRGQLGGTPAVLGRTEVVQLSGAQECNATGTCGVGDSDGTGTAAIRFRAADGQVCFKISVQNLRLPSVGAHIHQAARGVNGSIVVQFTAPDATGKAMGCTPTPQAMIEQILGGLPGYYANVHTTEFPGGAIRGQLGSTS